MSAKLSIYNANVLKDDLIGEVDIPLRSVPTQVVRATALLAAKARLHLQRRNKPWIYRCNTKAGPVEHCALQ